MDHALLKQLISFKDLASLKSQHVGRKEVLHENADVLSRLCTATECQNCARTVVKETVKLENSVLGLCCLKKILKTGAKRKREREKERERERDLEDPSIAIILQGKEIGIRPSWQEIAFGEATIMICWPYQDSLELRNDVLYKRWKAPNLKNSVAQLVVPKSRIQQILKQAHNFPSKRHFGINKTLEKILLGVL